MIGNSVARHQSAPGAMLFLPSHIAREIINTKNYNMFENSQILFYISLLNSNP
jgi:hypothetical protein